MRYRAIGRTITTWPTLALIALIMAATMLTAVAARPEIRSLDARVPFGTVARSADDRPMATGLVCLRHRGIAMNPRLRVLLAACAVGACCVAPAARPLLQLLVNPGLCAQRAESLAQVLLRIDSWTHLLRRSS